MHLPTTGPWPALPVPLKARAGLHVGPVILRENAPDDVARGAKPLEVEGLAKPTAARVMALARGGQTLLSGGAREALGKARAQLESHGHWMLKGLTEPVELFEVGDPDAPRSLQPPDGDKAYRVVRMGDRWLPVSQIPNNLPQQTTSFIGRERELAEVRALLGTSRLVTLLGMGGFGKTRLSLQVAAEQIARVPRRRLVPRPGTDPRSGARGQRGGAGARRARGTRPADAADAVRAPEAAPHAADPRQLRAPDQGIGADWPTRS